MVGALWLMTLDFDNVVARIETAYSRLEHSLGWSFLYSPARTFNRNTAIVFVALNPGGNRFAPPAKNVEEGNAYRIERWRRGQQLSVLQREICSLFPLSPDIYLPLIASR